MKKVVVGLLSITLLAGCNNSTGEEIAGGSLVDIGDFGNGYDLMRDKNTGCIYIYEKDAYSNPLTPYMNEEGKVAGCGEDNLDKSKYE